MNINTKFNVGEQVYFLEGGSLYYRPINRITIETKIDNSNKTKGELLIIYYFVLNPDFTEFREIYKYESEVAATKEDLITTLQVL
jgi:hypothetical protein